TLFGTGFDLSLRIRWIGVCVTGKPNKIQWNKREERHMGKIIIIYITQNWLLQKVQWS
ncbi:hypothetical protein ACJX0J_013833, partial [Zea mays]